MRLFLLFLTTLSLAAFTVESSARSCLHSGRYDYSMKLLSEQKSLGIISYNFENLIFKPRHKRKKSEQGKPVNVRDIKPEQAERANELADWMRKIERDVFQSPADIVLAQELIGVRSGRTFVREFFKGFESRQFEAHHSRGIQTGQFVNNSRPYHIEKKTYSHVKWFDPALGHEAPLFHKGIGATVVRPAGASKRSPPLFVTISVHLKSMRHRKGDPESYHKRSTQAQFIADKIIGELRREYGKNVPIIIGGDTNAPARAPELAPIREAGMKDVFDVVDLAKKDRATHVFFGNNRRGEPNQLDKIYVSSVLEGVVHLAGVQRYKEALPTRESDRDLQPSDHYPIYVQFSMQHLMKKYREATAKGRWD